MGEPPRSFHAVAPPLTAATWSFLLFAELYTRR
jgi:hypothetical protein